MANTMELAWSRGRLPLIGRERERATLSSLLQPGRLVLVSGAAGVGKTALVRAVRDEALSDASVLYVPDGRTLASATTWVATALEAAGRGSFRSPAPSRLRRLGRRARSRTIAKYRTRHEQAIVFDHVEYPGPRLQGLIELWLERSAVVLVARAERMLGRLLRLQQDCDHVRLKALDSRAAATLVETASATFRLRPLAADEVRMLVRLTGGLPGLITLALRVARRHPEDGMASLVRRARLSMLAHERDALIRGRIRRGDLDGSGSARSDRDS